MIVGDFKIEVGKMTAQSQRFGRGKNVVRHLGGRIRRECDLERSVAYHVKQDSAAKLLRSHAFQLSGKIAAAIEAVSRRESFVGFLAVKKNQFDLRRQIGILPKNSRQFQQQTGARPAVIRADKSDVVERFRVVMGAQ